MLQSSSFKDDSYVDPDTFFVEELDEEANVTNSQKSLEVQEIPTPLLDKEKKYTYYSALLTRIE